MVVYWLLKIILTPVLRAAFRVRVEGGHRVPKRGPVILASNHVSFCDSLFIPLVVHRKVTFVAKSEYFESWKTAWFFHGIGMIPMKRGGGSASDRALAAAGEVLAAGNAVGIYPEGTRSPDGRLYRGHTGVARLALKHGAVVVPMCTVGTAAVQPIGANRMRLGRRVVVRIGPPMTFEGYDASDRAAQREVTDRIMAAIGALSGQVPEDHYAARAAPAEQLAP